ncbi:MAG: glycosyltransferase family 39 protein [Alphaproteobacteria bacterium]|nr:glycosyltransferase family 39 protein [Alphaproteobacteria bacterium]
MQSMTSKAAGLPVAALLLAGLVLLGAALRLWDLGGPSLSHPEMYVPGLELPAGITEPPARFGFLPTLAWHFHDEPHPIGYYMAMGAWTHLFGTDPFVLRLPSALLGILSILLMYRLGSDVYGRTTGLLAAGIVALHGFLIYWSEVARNYSPGFFLALLATWLLVRLLKDDRPHWGLGAGYVAALFAGIQTTELVWALLALHMAYVIYACPDPGFRWGGLFARGGLLWRVPRLAWLQAIALMVSLPSLSHSLYNARRGAAPDPSLGFLRDYFGFGFLVEPDLVYVPVRILPLLPMLAVFALGAGLLVLGLRARAEPQAPSPQIVTAPALPLVALALASAGVLLWMAGLAEHRNDYMAALAVLPFGALALPPVAAAARPLIARLLPPLDRLLEAARPLVHPVALLAIVPPFVIYAMSATLGTSVMASRAFLVFVPFPLLLIAAGLVRLAPRPLLLAPAALAVAATLALGLSWNAGKVSTPRDYKGITQAMLARMEPGDIVLARHRDWADTPALYYLRHQTIVTGDYAAEIIRRAPRRVWVFGWTDIRRPRISPEMLAALEGYVEAEVLEARYAHAILFVPPVDRMAGSVTASEGP